MRMVTLDLGPIWKMQLLQTFLEERGVPSFLPDANLKTLDPTVTGTLSFDARLEVPEERLAEARAALEQAEAELAELRSASLDEQALAGTIEEGAPAVEAFAERERLLEPGTAEHEDLEALGLRLRWAALLPWTHPFALLYTWRYFRALARGVPVPRGHGLNLAALGLMVASWVVLLELVPSLFD
jgi:hypothetical protein